MKKLTFNRRNRRKRILDKVLRLIENKHFNLSNVTAWQTIVAARSSQILKATNAERFEKGIQSLLSQTYRLFRKSGRMVPARNAINATFRSCTLRDGKLAPLAKYGKEVPSFYWGAFVLTGDGGSPTLLDSR